MCRSGLRPVLCALLLGLGSATRSQAPPPPAKVLRIGYLAAVSAAADEPGSLPQWKESQLPAQELKLQPRSMPVSSDYALRARFPRRG